MMKRCVRVSLTFGAAMLALSRPALACPVCFGDPNSPMAIGASWGILVLLGITAGILSAFAGFFLYLAKRSRVALGAQIEQSR